ncbi:MAG: hypothetical protein D3911_16630 [Candidatus Electrothrix sp. AW3_4]|nr:hypothetical protein [Candidatus Electrothrix gigas]
MDTIILAVEVIALLGILIAILYMIYKVFCILITVSRIALFLSFLLFIDYIITPFEEKKRRKQEGLRAGGQTFIGYILIFIGGATFVYYLWQCIILKNLYWGKYPIVELAWPFISGVLLLQTS